MVRSVCVYLSSSDGLPTYASAIRELANELVRRDLTLVYGGAHRGLMGVLADARSWSARAGSGRSKRRSRS